MYQLNQPQKGFVIRTGAFAVSLFAGLMLFQMPLRIQGVPASRSPEIWGLGDEGAYEMNGLVLIDYDESELFGDYARLI